MVENARGDVKLRDYLRFWSISHAEMARLLGISRAAFSNYMTGKRRFPLETAVKIHRLTRFKVGIEEMVDISKKDK